MDTTTKIGIILMVYSIQVTVAAPAYNSSLDTLFSRRSSDKDTGRIFWTSLGDILEALPFLPFTINVPDVVSGIWGFFSGFFPGGGGNKNPPKNETTEVSPTRQEFIDYILY